MYVDTHCHLNFKAFDETLEEVLKRANDSEVKTMIIPGAKPDSSQRAVEIAKTRNGCFAAVGIHPHHVDEYQTLGKKETETKLTDLARQKKVVAIGEIGIDYHVYKGYPPINEKNKMLQKELFLLQMDIARNLNLPVIIHCRDAQEDLRNILTKYALPLSGVFHCFDGDDTHLRWVLDHGFYVGFDGNITYPDNERLRALVKKTPLDRLLLETDSPYLTPRPHRGKPNEPSFLPLIASCVSETKQISIDEVIRQTAINARLLFDLG